MPIHSWSKLGINQSIKNAFDILKQSFLFCTKILKMNTFFSKIKTQS